ncbi:hypothetical protein VTL71DRAFT_12947 [Oculimacula yallundae]|uniref:Nudix hydrolase domain-containing protein n=1 Tax=Oculimacula yallundae TaxID=86028 RepID=A0ABR4CPL4_9HELO
MPQILPPNFTPPSVPSFLEHHNITPREWSTTHPRFAELCVGGLIFRHEPLTQKPEILLIKRASTDFFPDAWEIPGGGVDSTDFTLLSAVSREVWEETGLVVKNIICQVWDVKAGEKVLGSDGKDAIVGAKPGEGEVEFTGGRGEIWCKLNFVVDVGEVKEGQVVLDPEEHQDWKWFDRQAIKEASANGIDFISEQAVRIMERGFDEYEKSN